MWGFLKSKVKEGNGIPSNLQRFLDKADLLYTSAYKTRSIIPMKEFLTRELCCKIANVVAQQGSQRYLSDPKFRKTKWTIKEGVIDIDKKVCILKEVEYDNITISPTRKMKVSTDYMELWEVDKDAPIVLDISPFDEEE